jgi:hypothetical protein
MRRYRHTQVGWEVTGTTLPAVSLIASRGIPTATFGAGPARSCGFPVLVPILFGAMTVSADAGEEGRVRPRIRRLELMSMHDRPGPATR